MLTRSSERIFNLMRYPGYYSLGMILRLNYRGKVGELSSHQLLWFSASIYLDPGFKPISPSIESKSLIHSATSLVTELFPLKI